MPAPAASRIFHSGKLVTLVETITNQEQPGDKMKQGRYKPVQGAMALVSLPLLLSACVSPEPQSNVFCWAERHQMVMPEDKWMRPPGVVCTPIVVTRTTPLALSDSAGPQTQVAPPPGPTGPGAPGSSSAAAGGGSGAGASGSAGSSSSAAASAGGAGAGAGAGASGGGQSSSAAASAGAGSGAGAGAASAGGAGSASSSAASAGPGGASAAAGG